MEILRILQLLLLLLFGILDKVWCCVSVVTELTVNSSDEQVLFSDLFCQYNKNVRPVLHHEEITIVFFEIALFNVLSLNTRDQKLMTNTEMIMKWQDHHLIWKPADYNNTKVIRVPYDSIWYPDIILYNTADANYRLGLIGTNAIIKYNGEVELIIHAMFQSTCEIDINYYPFDQQDCKMQFASWTYDITQLLLIQAPADLSQYSPHPEFYLENFYSELSQAHDPCCLNPFSMVTYHVQMQRRTMFAIYFFIMPGTIVNLCALLTFLLPAESGEKISLSTNALLAMMVFLMAMTQEIPPTEKVPLIGRYYGGCIGLLALNIAASVFGLSCHFNEDTVMSRTMSHVVQFMGRLIFLKPPEAIKNRRGFQFNSKVRKVESAGPLRTDLRAKSLQVPLRFRDLQLTNAVGKTSHDTSNFVRITPSDVNTSNSGLDNYQQRSLEALEGIHLILLDKELRKGGVLEADSVSNKEWRYMGRVIDRLFFIIFLLGFAIFNLAILMSSPHRPQFEYCPDGPGSCPDDWDAAEQHKLLEAGQGIEVATSAHHFSVADYNSNPSLHGYGTGDKECLQNGDGSLHDNCT